MELEVAGRYLNLGVAVHRLLATRAENRHRERMGFSGGTPRLEVVMDQLGVLNGGTARSTGPPLSHYTRRPGRPGQDHSRGPESWSVRSARALSA